MMKMRKFLVYSSISLAAMLILLIAAFVYSRSWKNALFIEPLYKIKTDQKVIALTFDDGPSATRTPALLEVLKKFHGKSSVNHVFFVKDKL